MSLHAITASRLRDGEVVWYAGDGAWAERLAEAASYAAPALDAALAEAKRSLDSQTVVDVYAIEVAPGAEGPVPVRLRERLRAAGPSVRLDLGKQAEPNVSTQQGAA